MNSIPWLNEFASHIRMRFIDDSLIRTAMISFLIICSLITTNCWPRCYIRLRLSRCSSRPCFAFRNKVILQIATTPRMSLAFPAKTRQLRTCWRTSVTWFCEMYTYISPLENSWSVVAQLQNCFFAFTWTVRHADTLYISMFYKEKVIISNNNRII